MLCIVYVCKCKLQSILDAGISPQSLIGSKTGVFIGCSISDSKDAFVHRMPPKDGYVVLG